MELSIKIFSPPPFGLLLESEPLCVGRLSTQSNSLLSGANKRESFRMGSSSDAEPMREGEFIWEKRGLSRTSGKGKSCSLHSFLSKNSQISGIKDLIE